MKQILLAEDDNDMRRFLTRALQNAGYEVVSFDNGRSAYERLREEPFALLLTDIVMPEMDGIELARRATELDPDLKVMFITGFAAVALNPDSDAPKDAKVLSQALPPQGPRQRGRAAARRPEARFGPCETLDRRRGLYGLSAPRPEARPARKDGRVAQRESTTLTS